MSLGLRLISAIIRDGDRSAITHLNDSMFIQEEMGAYRFFRAYYSEQGVMPPIHVMRENGHNLEDVPAAETVNYLVNNVHRRAKYNVFNSNFEDIQSHMRSRNMDELSRIMNHVLGEFASITSTTEIMSLGGIVGGVLESTRGRRLTSGELSGVTYGYDSLNDRTGGIQRGELFVLAGRPNQGKSYILLNMAHKAWVDGNSVLFISMEMHEVAIARRLMGIEACINPDLLKSGMISDYALNRFIASAGAFTDASRPPFNLVSGNFKKSVSDVDAAIQLHNPDIVYVDAGYLLKPTSKFGKKDRRELISEVIEELKSLALLRNVPIAISVQFNRQVKRKQKADLDLANIAETDVIGQVADVIVGVQEPDDGGDTKNKRKVTIVKNREGPVFDSFLTHFTFAPLDFSEIVDSGEEEAQGGWAS